jgi:hypothetical protein
MARSEALAAVCLPLWELRAGHRRRLPPWVPKDQPPADTAGLIERILPRLDDFAARWSALPEGGNLTLRWPVPPKRRFAVGPRDAPRGARRKRGAATRRARSQ